MNSEQQQYMDWIGAALRDYEGPLLRYAQRFTGDLHRARDIVQDTFFRLCRQRRADVESHLRPWLFKVCRNRALELLRQQRPIESLDATHENDPSRSGPTPAELAETRDSGRRAMELLSALPVRQQEVVRLKFQDGLSYKEISDVTGLTVTNVGFIIHTAIQKLRRQLLDTETPLRGGAAPLP